MEFKFKQQQYQADAVRAVTDVFCGQRKQASGSSFEMVYANAPVDSSVQLLQNVQRVQRSNNIKESDKLSHDMGACHLEIKMETGTGKTYVYTKTMLELNRLYGWTKFIVVVPNLAIREGVFKSLQNTKQHFFEQYGKSINFFIYNPKTLVDVDNFARCVDIRCMIINIQSFNARDEESNIISRECDNLFGSKPIDLIANTQPIVILDEPQTMGKNGSATREGIARFEPLFVLDYSATPTEEHNLVYVLDAVDAYKQHLVKKIRVTALEDENSPGTDGYLCLKKIEVSKSKPPVAIIEHEKMDANGQVNMVKDRFREGGDIYKASGAKVPLEAYKGYVIDSDNNGIVPGHDGHRGYVHFLNVGENLYEGKAWNDSAQKDMRRRQIRETIRAHLNKEEKLFRRGIKCLSLFFIDEVAKYRSPDGGKDGEYGRMFEKEYVACKEERLSELEDAGVSKDDPYVEYLQRDEVYEVHDGYFSKDKKGRWVDTEEGTKNGRENALRGYDLILKNKEKLLSFDEPVRFIFSHSALREGWDNPNVFQICMLKESSSDVTRRQEVGRGLRLCVDQKGERQDGLVLENKDMVQSLNTLTVIPSESYKTFVAGLQGETEATLYKDRPKSVKSDSFTGRVIMVNVNGMEVPVAFDEKQSDYAHKFLFKNDYIDDDDFPTDKFRLEAQEGTFVKHAIAKLHEGINDEAHAKAIQKLVQSVYGAVLDDMVAVVDEEESNSFNEENRCKFQFLWERINKKHAYTVKFDDGELRQLAIDRINKELQIGERRLTLITGESADGATIDRLETSTESIQSEAPIDAKYDLVGAVARNARITRRSAADILSQIEPEKFALFKLYPDEFIAKCSKLIRDVKSALMTEHIQYHEINADFGTIEDNFSTEIPKNRYRQVSSKGIQSFVLPDSEIESSLADAMDKADEVAVYAKLPESLYIPTPIGKYTPDWAVVFKEGRVSHVYLVAESKGTMDSNQLRAVENIKIECAEKLFEQLSDGDVIYHQVVTYDDLLDAAQPKGRGSL